MKTAIKLFLFIISLSFFSCNTNLNFGDGIEGSGNVVTEKRTIKESFEKVTVSTGINLLVEQGTPNAVEVETDDNLLQYVITKVENGTLIVKMEGNINTLSSIDVRIRMNTISGLESTSGSRINTKNTLRGTSLAIKSSSGSEINAKLEYESISCESSSGSNITVAGKTLKLTTASSSGSEIDANELAANDVYSQSTSGSTTRVKPILKLDAKASSGSTIEYVQAPKSIEKEETSGGSVDEN